MKCGERFSGTVMAPIPYPAVGWEPVQDSDECEREQGHDGKHRGKRIEWAAPAAPETALAHSAETCADPSCPEHGDDPDVLITEAQFLADERAPGAAPEEPT